MRKLVLDSPLPLPQKYSFSLWILAAVVCTYPLSALLPAPWGWENGFFENVQVAVLLLGCLNAVLVARSQGGHSGALAATAAPIWLLLAGRELSWGAALLPPVAYEAGQPVYSSADFWFHPLIAPAVLLLLLWFVVSLFRRGLYRPLWRALLQQRELQAVLVLGLVAGACSAGAEGHFGWRLAFSAERAEIVEEAMELIAYFALVCAQYLTLQGMQRQGK